MGTHAFVPPSLTPAAAPRGMDRRAEALALVLIAGALFLALALASLEVDPADPEVHGPSWMGMAGHALAAFLATGFGAAVWLIPMEGLLFALPLLFGRRPLDPGLRLAGDGVILVLLAALLEVLLPGATVFGRADVGGNVGLLFGEVLRGLFSTPGSVLVLGTSILLILIGRASFSLLEFYERMQRAFSWLCARVVQLSSRWIQAWREAKQLRALEAELAAPAVAEPTASNGSTFHDPEATGPWVPCEVTGRPPLSVIQALRRESALGAEDSGAFWGDALEGEGAHEPEGASATSHSPKESAILEQDSADSPSAPVELLLGSDDSAEGESEDETDEAEEPELGREEDEVRAAPPAPGLPRIVDTSAASAPRVVRRSQMVAEKRSFELPSPLLLEEPPRTERTVDRSLLLGHAGRLEKTLLDYGVTGKVEEIHPGPTVTTFEVSPSAGTKVSKVASLSDDLALGLSRKVRIIAPIPGKGRIGFEIPNDRREAVYLRDLIQDERFAELGRNAPLPIVLGRDIVGGPCYADLASMPHVIVAGATGAGKSVGINVMLSSLLFSRTPEELRLLLIDPKVVELAPFDRIPHLLLPVVTDMKQAAKALLWAVDEMERRYQLFADAGTKNIGTYNRHVDRVLSGEIQPKPAKEVLALGPNQEVVSVSGTGSGTDGAILPERIPYIVIVVDEFADLMMQQGKEVEAAVARLAQKARAAGMHVILATQRPSVDVITGMIKANFPTRIAFRVAQKVDSRTILDEQGAEVLLGKGDMLVKMNGAQDTMRVQCPFISEDEVSALTDHLRAQAAPQYQEAILAAKDEESSEDAEEEKADPRFEEAVLIVRDTQRCSTSWLQRKMTIGYNRAAKIVEMMENRGMVGPPNGSKDREVLLMP